MKNSIKSAIQSFKNFKLYTSINLFGLILGLTCSTVIFLYVSYEYSFDNFHQDKERIFRVIEISTSPKSREISPSLRMPYGPALKNEISEIEDVVRLRNNRHVNTLKFDSKEISLEKAIFADPNLFSFFSFKTIYGNPEQLLMDKNSLVLTQKISERLFGNENPLGKLVEYDNNSYTITGVVEDVPLNSHLQFNAVFPIEALIGTPDVSAGWDSGLPATTFVKLYTSSLENNVEQKLPDFLQEKVNERNEDSGSLTEFYLEPLGQIHLFSKVDWDSNSKDGKFVILLLLIGSIILLIAIINYLFISNGTLTIRLKEFSIKNYFGLGESGIRKQIFTDSLLLFVLAGTVSVILLFAFEAFISQLFKADFLSFQLEKNVVLFFLALVAISSITSYIQFVTYKRKAVKGSGISSSSQPFLRKKLVYISTLQFCISIGLISSMIVVYMQLNFALHKDLGFAVENVINVSAGAIGAKQKVLIAELKKLPGVANASASFGVPGLETAAMGYQPEGGEQSQPFSVLFVDDNFFDTFQLELLEGRNFREGVNSDTKELIVNETLAKQLNWKNAVGKSMNRNGKHEIIGVVKDFHVGLIYNIIPPLIISKQNAEMFYALSIALKPGETQQSIEQIKSVWNKIMPGVQFKYAFMNTKFESLYSEMKQTAIILLLFTAISILISILGLFGITFLLMNSKVKEIGIRKVNGASILEIVKMLNFKFIKWVAIAFVIAVPIAWYIMTGWLENFAYKIELSWWIFALAGGLAFLIALITISWQTFLAARRNPIEALRYE